MRVNESPQILTTQYINKFDIQLMNLGSSALETNYEIPYKISGPCILKIQGISSRADTDVSAGFDAYIVNK